MILYCCQDLIFATKIRSTAESLNVATKPVKANADLSAFADNGNQQEQDANAGPGAIMVDLELGEDALNLIENAHHALPGARIIAFGSHVARDVLDAAKAHGADQVLPRSAFTEQLPALLQSHGGNT